MSSYDYKFETKNNNNPHNLFFFYKYDKDNKDKIYVNGLIEYDKIKNISIKKGNIYRILPMVNNNNLHLMVLSERPDKKKPNREDIVNRILQRVYNKWTVNDIFNIYDPSKHIYYDADSKDSRECNDITYLLSLQKEIIKTSLSSLKIEDKNVIDIGTGNGSLGRYMLKNMRINKHIGIDIDPVELGTNILPMANQYLIWGNPNDKTEYFTQYEINNGDILMFVNSLNYFENNRIIGMTKYLKKGGLIFIYSLFSELIDDNINDLQYNRIFNITKINTNNKYVFRYPWRKREFEERVHSYKDIIKLFESNNMKLLNDNNSSILFELKKDRKYKLAYYRYGSFIDSHKLLIFEKIE